MIISKKYKFIFFKTFRSNTENFELKVFNLLGNLDYLSLKERSSERYLLRKTKRKHIVSNPKLFLKKKYKNEININRTLKNFFFNIFFLIKLDFNFVKIIDYKDILKEHETIINVKREIKKKIFEKYYKFCFYRKFSSAFISEYIYNNPKKIIQKDFENDFYLNHKTFFESNNEIFSYKNKILVDAIYPFEKLEKSFKKLIKKLNLNVNSAYFVKKKINASKSKKKLHYNKAMKKIIEKMEKNSVINSNEFKKKLVY